MPLSLVQLRALAAVAHRGSVTGAARDLHYTQPSVSHHLSRPPATTAFVHALTEAASTL
jgi:DNA-binding transcriptional LysR family regulator